MDLQADLAAIQDGGHIGGDDRIHAGGLGRIEGLVRRSDVLSVENDVEGHIGPHPGRPADPGDFREIFRCKIIGRMGPHIEPADSEINGVGSTLDGSLQAFEIARR